MRDEITATLKYAVSKQLVVLYVLLFVGLSLLNWNVFLPLFGVLGGFNSTIAVALRGIFGFLTSIAGFAITAIAFVAIVRTVVDDALGEDSVALTEDATATVEADDADDRDTDDEAEPAEVAASEDGQTAE